MARSPELPPVRRLLPMDLRTTKPEPENSGGLLPKTGEYPLGVFLGNKPPEFSTTPSNSWEHRSRFPVHVPAVQ